jgi:ABC-type cobalamin/Fe3+-siderophores transport system ATPase subunit
MVLDEPTSGLDLGVEHRLMQLLAELNRQEKLTLVCVTHDLNAAARYGSQVALLHDGIVETIPPAQLLQGQTLDRLYQDNSSKLQRPL